MAASIAAGLASAAPKLMFSVTLAENRVGSSNAQPIRARSCGRASCRMSVPSSRIGPGGDVGQPGDQLQQGGLAGPG